MRTLLLGLVLGGAMLTRSSMARAGDTIDSPKALRAALATNPGGADAENLAAQLRTWFGSRIDEGSIEKVEGLDMAFGIEVETQSPPHVVFNDGHPDLVLTRVGQTNIYAGTVTMPEMATGHFVYKVDGKQRGGGGDYELYAVDPAGKPDPGVPHGIVTKQRPFHCALFPQTTRDWWIYVPVQYKPENPACVMIFQDGGSYLNSVPTVFDNLIAKGEMPVTVGIFIQPGELPKGVDAQGGRGQRSFEYDSVSDLYARFLLEEILPEVEKTIKLRHDPASRAIGGLSSGAACAFTVAWYRSDQFSKVLSWIGSYTNLQGGKTGIEGAHNYPFLIRMKDKKPIRVFLQDGDHDLDNPFGNWPLANQSMAKALAFKGYDYQFVYGHGGHSGKMGTAYLPQSLRWLWRDYKPE